MASSSSEDLRNLLRAAQVSGATPVKAGAGNNKLSGAEFADLQSLIGSVNLASIPSINGSVNSHNYGARKSQELADFETASQASFAESLKNRWKGSDGFQSDDSFVHSSDRPHDTHSVASSIAGGLNKENDILDYTVIKFGADYVLRGKLGRYLAARGVTVTAPPPSAINAPVNPQMAKKTPVTQTSYNLEINGQGIGESVDCLNFVNLTNKDDTGPIKYGMVVALKAPSAKERLLGLKEGTRLGFWRHFAGDGEKFQILKGIPYSSITSSSGSSSGGVRAGSSTSGYVKVGLTGLEEPHSRGKYARIGDLIVLQSAKSEQLLSLYEGVDGVEARLIFKDRIGLGTELWQLEQFGAVPLPGWYHARPYLSGKYLTIPAASRAVSADAELRNFPKSASASATAAAAPPTPPLTSLTVSAQHLVLLRDLLNVMSGIEGQHIRVAAAPTTTAAAVAASVTALGGSAVPPSVASAATGGGSGSDMKVSDVTLTIDMESADKSTVSQVMTLFPLCECAIRVREFIKMHSRYEFGYVSHAVCAAIKTIVREFDSLLSQLEHLYNTGNLSLQKLVYLLQPSKNTMFALDRLTKRLCNHVGGKLIDTLHGCLLEQGDPQSKELLTHLLVEGSKPFLKMLSLWIFRGELNDPYKEFMIFEDTSVSKEALEQDFNAQYWETRYTLREEHTPRILKSHAQKALIAGKYLNVIRGCLASNNYSSSSSSSTTTTGAAMKKAAAASAADAAVKYVTHSSSTGLGPFTDAHWKLPEEKELPLSLEISDNALSTEIEEAYLFSSRALLKLLEVNHKLSVHLQSLRRFFLLEHGDFFIQFMDTAEEELCREVQDVVLNRIQSLLQTAVQTSTLAVDPNREELSCILASHNLIQHLNLIQSAGEVGASEAYSHTAQSGLKGVEAFTLDYRVGWPLSIILSRRAVTKYQLLSRLLYFSKHVERRVLTCWMGHQNTKQLNVRVHMSSSYCLRHRMLHFLQNFVYYMTLEVINPHSHELQEAMKFAEDMDEVMGLHEKFLDSCLNECLLANQELLKVLTQIMTTCLWFADHMNHFKENENSAIDRTIAANTKASAAGGTPSNKQSSNSSSGSRPVTLSRVALKQIRMSAQEEFIQTETTLESFPRSLAKFADTFDNQLKEFLERLHTDSYRNHGMLSNLCVRLDYNGFYSDNLEGQQ